MNEERLEAYRKLIEQLLKCSSRAEVLQILNDNRDLVDAELIQIMLEIANSLRIWGELDKSSFLMNLVGQLMGVYDNTPLQRLSSSTTTFSLTNSESQISLLLEIGRVTADSNGNPQVVYPLLEANLDKLNDSFATVLKTWAAATLPNVEPEQAQRLAATIISFSILFKNFPLGDRGCNVEIAIAGYKIAAAIFTRNDFAEYWATVQNNLGEAYRIRIRGERAENLETAISYFSAALEVRTRQAFPKQWATTQNNLGAAYNKRIRGERAENLEAAIQCYSAALEVFTCQAFPEDWAMTQVNMGAVYSQRIRGERAENLEVAICHYSAALEVYTHQSFPDKWATTQCNLGAAYLYRIQGEKAENLEVAIHYLSTASQVHTHQAFPQSWADTQINLGAAYSERIRGERAENLEVAICHYSAALEVCTRQTVPGKWATLQNNLGNAYKNRIKGERAENLEVAIGCLLAALDVHTRQAFPEDWAHTKNNLGNTYCDRILSVRAENLEAAIRCYSAALGVYTREAFPEDWARTQNNLGNTYRERILGVRAENLEASISYFAAALQIRTLNSLPEGWAATQNGLGNAYLDRIKGERAENLEAAIRCYSAALGVYTREAFPVNWAAIQNNLGNAYLDRIKGERAENLEAAVECYSAALGVYTREAFPVNWASTQDNLGNAYSERIKGERAENLETAIRCYLSALKVRSRQTLPQDWARTQNNLGNTYCDRILGVRAENLEAAINHLSAALEVRTQQAFPEDWAATQNNLGKVYSQRIRGKTAENLERAISHFSAALEVRTRQTFPELWAKTRNNLGLACRNHIRGEKAESLEAAICYLSSTLEVYTREAFPEDWANTQNSLGVIYSERIWGERPENVEVAIGCYFAALEVYTCEAFPENWATIQNNLGNAYSNRIQGERAENVEIAIRFYRATLEVRTCQTFPQEYAQTQTNLGRTYQATQQFHNAYNAFTTAIETVESLRGEMVSSSAIENDKQILAEKWNELYRWMVEVCLELGNLSEAIEYIERSKTRNLVEQILERDLKAIFPSEVVIQLEQYRDEIVTGQYEIQSGTADNPTALAQRLQQARHQRNKLQNRYLPVGHGFQFQHFQNTMDDHTVIVEFYITGNKLLTFLFTRQTYQPILWRSQSQDLKQLVNWANEYLQAYYTEKSHWQPRLTNRLHSLAQILHIDEIIQKIPQECDRLIFIPHRYLHLFPLHALPISSQPGETTSQLLMHRFPAGVGYAPSCQLLEFAQTRKHLNFTNLFAIQNPTDDLTYTDLEVKGISTFFSESPPEILASDAATEVSLKANQNLEKAHCIHFSCHGRFNLNSPFDSALLLAEFTTLAEAAQVQVQGLEDGLLTLAEIFEKFKFHHCRLVTLSACETGLVDFNNISDEYIGLPSGFLYAGASSVVSSLWTVNDLSTAFLMIKFYENLKRFSNLNTGDVAIALNQAQLWLRDATRTALNQWIKEKDFPLNPTLRLSLFKGFNADDKPFHNPFHWAAFCAIGQ